MNLGRLATMLNRKAVRIGRYMPTKLKNRVPWLNDDRVIRILDSLIYNRTDEILTETIDGITYELDLNELIDRTIFRYGAFEIETTRLIERYVKPGMHVIDIGANIGCHTLRFAKLVGRTGCVIAFEPMQDAYVKLLRNKQLNNFSNIKIERKALSDVETQDRIAEFRYSWRVDKKDILNECKVDFVTLDDYSEREDIKKLDFIKLDVDGYEYKVLKGAVQTIRKFKPLILIELASYTLNSCGDDICDLVNLIELQGYSFYSENGELLNTDSMIDSIPKEGSINVLLKPVISDA